MREIVCLEFLSRIIVIGWLFVNQENKTFPFCLFLQLLSFPGGITLALLYMQIFTKLTFFQHYFVIEINSSNNKNNNLL